MLSRLLLGLAAPFALVACTTVSEQAPAPVAVTRSGVVEAADPRAAAAGREMLERGGSATDAAIAVMLALNVVEPQSSGIGGGGFMVRGTADGTVVTFDGRETAPAAAGPDWFLTPAGERRAFNEVVTTGLSVGVPGNIALAAEVHERYGRLPWAALFEPAIRLADEGFVVNPRLNSSLDGYIERAGLDPAMRATFYTEDGRPRPVGSIIRRPDLAETFRRLAADGPAAMYGPGAAAEIAAHVAANTPRADGAALTAADFESYEAKERPALCGHYRGYRLCSMGPPSSGGMAVLAILGELERFDLAALGPDSVAFWHLFAQAQLLAYADRELYVADPDFVDVPAEELVAPAYLAARSQLIDPARALGTYPAGTPEGVARALVDGAEPDESGTSHFVVIGDDGTMISYTTTVEGGFGSGLAWGGFHLNNELTDFSFAPEVGGIPVANRVEGGKRPRSSMSPTLIWDAQGRPFLAIGGGGGNFIPVEVARSIIGVIDFRLELEDALGLPLVMGFGRGLYVEEGTFPAAHQGELEALGYVGIRSGPQPFGSVGTTAALSTGEGWITARDPRFLGRLEAPAVTQP